MKSALWLVGGLLIGVIAYFIYDHYQTIQKLYKNRDIISTAANAATDASNLWGDATALWTEFKGR